MTTTPPPVPQPLVAIGAITAVFVLGRTKHDVFRSKDAAPAASQTASALAADPPSAPKDREGQFLWRIAVQGLQMRRSNDAAINDARRVCTRYAGGESEQQIIQDMLAGSPGMSLNTASTFADTAISVYCPDGYIDQP
jgi:Protein of unknown function (DUF732)